MRRVVVTGMGIVSSIGNNAQEVLASLTKNAKQLYVIPEALHRITENPRKAQSVFRQLLHYCLKEFYPLESSLTVHDPPQRASAL